MAKQQTTPELRDLADLDALIARMRGGERRALSRVVTELERFSPSAQALLQLMQPYLGAALIIGITGPPGAGKSTLLNSYITHARGKNLSVGVIAVDPSSPISGGAILGDRIRMGATLDDDGVFMRSLASRGGSGGLSSAAVRVIDALDAAGKDIVLLETVGTGQSEMDIADVADVSIVVSAPGLGDGVQAMKAGLIEIADVVVVNKGDREGADLAMQQLQGALHLRLSGQAGVPLFKTTATTGEGIAALVEAVEALGREKLRQPATLRRRKRARLLIARAAADEIAKRIKAGQREGAGNRLDELCDAVLAGSVTAGDAAKKLLGG